MYFAVDDDVLDELLGADHPRAGATSLLRVCRPLLNLREPSSLFGGLAELAYRWAGNRYPGVPPFLPGLALTVLAASRMDASDGVAPTNYYRRLRQVLEISESPEAAFRETVPSIFRVLDEWLRASRAHSRGLSTIPPNPTPEHVGYPISQTAFRASDRRKLTAFFREHRLKPTDVDLVQALLPELRRWSSRAGLSIGARRLLEAPEMRMQAAAIVTAELATWDETEVDERGHKIGQLRLMLAIAGRPRWGLLATRPAGLPEEADFNTPGGRRCHLRSTVDGYYDPLWLEGPNDPTLIELLNTAPVLRSGIWSLRFQRADVMPMRPDPVSNSLTTRRRVEPGERHWVLASEAISQEVLRVLASTAREGWRERDASAPLGWRLISDVFIDHPPLNLTDERLSPLIPTVDARPQLVGGLPVGRANGEDIYLEGAEPELWVPSWLLAEQAVVGRFDGRAFDWRTADGHTNLGQLASGMGVHLIELGSFALRFRNSMGVVGFPVTGEAVCGVTVELAPAMQPSHPASLCGAVAVGGEPPNWPIPLHLPYGGSSYFVFGRKPGDVLQVAEQALPAWLAEVDLLPMSFEVYPRFDALWIAIRWRKSGWELKAVSDDVLIGARDPDASLDHWLESVAEVADVDGPRGWQRYVETARELNDVRAV